ncbi:MAG: Na+/H+ antiporter subunit E [Candidatus Margulisbacteria bacterium]|nr:Na+/H+ antiporter subunit E [Candidatus Margulisiibacteriota bacterium]
MKIGQLEKINSIIITFIFLMLLWYLFTFSLDPFSLLLGGAFSLVIALATYDLFIEKEEKVQRGILPRFELFIFYLLILLWEIYLGSFNVVYRVITMKINPGIIKIKTKLGSKLGRALLANSITLTPGTVAIDLKDDELFVHWLVMDTSDSNQAAKQIKGNFEAQLGRIFY